VHVVAERTRGGRLVFTEMVCVAADDASVPDAPVSIATSIAARGSGIVGLRALIELPPGSPAARACRAKARRSSAGKKDDEPLAEGNWPLIARPDRVWTAQSAPRAMTARGQDAGKPPSSCARAAGARNGVRLAELHCAHGYLLSAFLCR